MATFARSLRCLKTGSSNCMLTRAFNGQNPAKLGKAVDNDQCVVYFLKATSTTHNNKKKLNKKNDIPTT